jgi:hypothetical protein
MKIELLYGKENYEFLILAIENFDNKKISYVDWIDNFKNIFIKEMFYKDQDYTNLLNKSEKVICLYRENWYAQVRSLLFQEKQAEFLFSYDKKDVDKEITEGMIMMRYKSHHKIN